MPPVSAPTTAFSKAEIRTEIISVTRKHRPTRQEIDEAKENQAPHPMDNPQTRSAFALEQMRRKEMINFYCHVLDCPYCKSLLFDIFRERPPLIPVRPAIAPTQITKKQARRGPKNSRAT